MGHVILVFLTLVVLGVLLLCFLALVEVVNAITKGKTSKFISSMFCDEDEK